MSAQVHSFPTVPDHHSRATYTQEELDQLKGQFLASLNHEIRTPLSGVIGMADLLLETKLDAEQRELVDTARNCAQQLLTTLNAILEYSSISAGTVELRPQEFHVAELIEQVIDDCRIQASHKGLRLEKRIAAVTPETLVGDATQLRVIVSHLVRNAIKFTARGFVEVRIAVEQDLQHPTASVQLQIEVEDSGIGIDPEKKQGIFESFRQLDSGLARSYPGLGLGLAIVEKLLRRMGGTIGVQSEPGRGSTFCVRVPAGLAHAAPPAVVQLPSAPSAPSNRANILVVEDNPIAQQIITRILNANSFRSTFAGCGQEGIAAARRGQFDLVLMDLQMPDLDGFATTRAIRQIDGYEKCPIIALTANCSDEYRRKSAEAGMQGFLGKPINRQEILATLELYFPSPVGSSPALQTKYVTPTRNPPRA
jgi:CheY-like chemotaxis protein/anti-sigma regulatory factor (Ser/Thr protein kinase)